MAYTAVPTVSTCDLWTAAQQNTYLRDNSLVTMFLESRQGGSATAWGTAGTTDYSASSIMVQIGSVAWSGSASNDNFTVTYPDAFSYTPIILITPLSNNARVTATAFTVGATTFDIYWESDTTETSLVFFWMAIGPR